MLGLGLLVRLGRKVLVGPLAEAGLMPASYYRHLALSAMEGEDFPRALNYLKWAADPLLAQLLVLKLRLLAARHAQARRAAAALLPEAPNESCREKCRALVAAQDRALGLLSFYETRALGLLK